MKQIFEPSVPRALPTTLRGAEWLLAVLLAGCSGAGPHETGPRGESAWDDETGELGCGTFLPDRVRLELETYNWGYTERPAVEPGRLRSWIARSQPELENWLYAGVGHEGSVGSFDWDTEVALVGYLDTTQGLPSVFGITQAEGLGTDELETRWCVVWPEATADSDSRVVRVYAIPPGDYSTLREKLDWEGP